MARDRGAVLAAAAARALDARDEQSVLTSARRRRMTTSL
jgi:hypothetical protein